MQRAPEASPYSAGFELLCYVRPPHTNINNCLKLKVGALMTNHTPMDKGKTAKTIRQLMGVAWPEQRPRSTCS